MGEFLDFRPLGSCVKNTTLCTDGSKLDWRTIRVLEVDSVAPSVLKVKTDYDEEFRMVDTLQSRSKTIVPTLSSQTLKQMRTSPLPVSKDKYDDLSYICKHHLIPEEYHDFYFRLPHNTRSNSEE